MGDRGNVFVWDGETQADDEGHSYPVGVYLYTHWGGTELPEVVRKALGRKVRWNDAPYLTRIIFDEMTLGQHGSETGHGISTSICDNEHPIIVVDVPNQTVGLTDVSLRVHHLGALGAPNGVPFADYIQKEVTHT